MLEEPNSLIGSMLGETCGLKGLRGWYSNFLLKPQVKFTAVVSLLAVLGTSAWGCSKLTDGLDLTDVVPRSTMEHAYLAAQGQYFGFYNMHAVTGAEFEYPTNQRLLYEYHEAFMRVQNIIKNDNGGLQEFWLGHFRDWLIGKLVHFTNLILMQNYHEKYVCT